MELVRDGDQFGGDAASAKDVQGGEGFGLFEPVSQEDVCVVHAE